MFEKASRLKIRYDSPNGQLSVEDLWDLPLTSSNGARRANLDDIAVRLDKELRESETTSFVKKTNKTNALTRLKFDIVLKVIEVRQAEAEVEAQKQARSAQKQKLLEIIAEKEDESLKGKSIDELQNLVNKL